MPVRTIETTVHGRFLYENRGADRLVVGFHGYGETADAHLAELQRIPGIDRWSVAAVQALHPFYTRAGQVVASWMTSLDREHAIADNLAYVSHVLASLAPPRLLVFVGFSQGAAMAARAAAHHVCNGLILLGGDVPPEIKADSEVRLPPVLLARGANDEWYTDAKFQDDLAFLEPRTQVTRCVFAGGHEWADELRVAAGFFLDSL